MPEKRLDLQNEMDLGAIQALLLRLSADRAQLRYLILNVYRCRKPV